jgi:hypothetical protein
MNWAASAGEWDMVYYSPGAGQFVGFGSRAEAQSNTWPKTTLSKGENGARWCTPDQPGCPLFPAGMLTLVLPVDDINGTPILQYTGSELMKGTSWRLADGTPTYNVMSYAFNHYAGLDVPAFSMAQIQLLRAYLTIDIRTQVRAPDGPFIYGGRPSLGGLR